MVFLAALSMGWSESLLSVTEVDVVLFGGLMNADMLVTSKSLSVVVL